LLLLVAKHLLIAALDLLFVVIDFILHYFGLILWDLAFRELREFDGTNDSVSDLASCFAIV
jgi:hypothetical protein